MRNKKKQKYKETTKNKREATRTHDIPLEVAAFEDPS